ncbi:hypothetical protein ABT008_08645 [Micromonospora sp. NPDC002389]|uniref:hypothetical protein n=1 Tax=Micromonospora sp. NPDC002389 TaxID=3154272 RepID=UPI003333CE94
MLPDPSTAPVGSRRPHRRLVVAAVLAAGTVLLGVVGLSRFLPDSGGDLGQRFAVGQPVILHLSSKKTMVWGSGVESNGQDVSCAVSAAGGPEIEAYSELRLLDTDIERTVDGILWHGLLLLSAEPAGRYEVTCTAVANWDLAAGDPPRMYGPRAVALGQLAAWGLAGAGVVAGVVLAVRRRRSTRPDPPVSNG